MSRYDVVSESATTYALATIGLAKGINEVFIQPHLNSKRAWGALALGILVYELAAPRGELMSEGADKALESHPLLTYATIGTVACHLANILPEWIDPIHQSLKFLKNL